MDITAWYISISILLVGLHISRLSGPLEQIKGETAWTNNSCLMTLYGSLQIIGFLLAIGSMLVLCFKEHWWYCLVFLGLSIGTNIISALITYIVEQTVDPIFPDGTLKQLFVRRLIGSIMIIGSVIVYIMIA